MDGVAASSDTAASGWVRALRSRALLNDGLGRLKRLVGTRLGKIGGEVMNDTADSGCWGQEREMLGQGRRPCCRPSGTARAYPNFRQRARGSSWPAVQFPIGSALFEKLRWVGPMLYAHQQKCSKPGSELTPNARFSGGQ